MPPSSLVGVGGSGLINVEANLVPARLRNNSTREKISFNKRKDIVRNMENLDPIRGKRGKNTGEYTKIYGCKKVASEPRSNVHFIRHHVAFCSSQGGENNNERNQLHDGNKANSRDKVVKLWCSSRILCCSNTTYFSV